MTAYQRLRAAFEGLPKPLAFVDLDVVDANADALVARARGKPIRVASKSVRSVAVLQRLLDRDGIEGVLAFTAPEAVWLAEQGIDDLVVGYPTWDVGHVEAVARAVAEGRRITLMVDDVVGVDHLNTAAARVGVRLPVCLEADASIDLPGLRFGVYRSPVQRPEQALTVAAKVADASHLRLDGVMIYEAQIAGMPDRAPGQGAKNPVIRALKARSVRVVAERRHAIVGALHAAGHDLRFVNGGGTGSLETTAAERAVTEVTAGSGFYAPGLFDHYDAFRHEPAAGFALEIVRRPAPDIYTCLGGGYVASGAPGVDKIPVPYLPEGAQLIPTEAAGEVQTPVRYDGPESLDLGDPVFFRHAKAGELCERFTHLHCVAGSRVDDEVTTYRGDGMCFL